MFGKNQKDTYVIGYIEKRQRAVIIDDEEALFYQDIPREFVEIGGFVFQEDLKLCETLSLPEQEEVFEVYRNWKK